MPWKPPWRSETTYGGTVTVISMGPPKAADVLRDCLWRGADRAILLTDRRAAASDTLATSYILAQAVRTVGPLRLRLLRPAGDRRRHGPGRTAIGGEAGHHADHLPGGVAGRRRRRGADPPQCGPRLGDRRGQAAGAGDGDRIRPMSRDRLAARRVMRYKRAQVPAEIAGRSESGHARGFRRDVPARKSSAASAALKAAAACCWSSGTWTTSTPT